MTYRSKKMMTKNEVIQSIINRMEEIQDEYCYAYIGVRVQENEFKVGETLDNSYVWVDGVPTDEELDGTCALMLKDTKLATTYSGNHVSIIGGNNASYGEDFGEIIIREAEVLEVLM